MEKEIVKNPNDKKNALILFITLIVVFFIFKSCLNQPSNKNIEAYVFTQQLVEEKLKSPGSANFQTYNENLISVSGNIYTIKSYVDAQNSFGANTRNQFTCVLRYENNLYFVEKLTINQ